MSRHTESKTGLPIQTVYNLSPRYSVKGDVVLQDEDLWVMGPVVVFQGPDDRWLPEKGVELHILSEEPERVNGKLEGLLEELRQVAKGTDLVPAKFVEIQKNDESEMTLVTVEAEDGTRTLYDGALIRFVMRKSKGNFSHTQTSLSKTTLAIGKAGGFDNLVILQGGEPLSLIVPMKEMRGEDLHEFLDGVSVYLTYEPDYEPADDIEDLQAYVEAQRVARLQAFRDKQEADRAAHMAEIAALQAEPEAEIDIEPEEIEEPETLPVSLFVGDMLPALPAPNPILVDIEKAEPATVYLFTHRDMDMVWTIQPYYGLIEVQGDDTESPDLIMGAHPDIFYLQGSDLEEEGTYMIEDLGLVVYDLLDNGFMCKPGAPEARYDEELAPVDLSDLPTVSQPMAVAA